MMIPLLTAIAIWIAIAALIVRDCRRAQRRSLARLTAAEQAAAQELERVCAEWRARKRNTAA
jgi:hypothetical protein